MQIIERDPKETAREYAIRAIRHNIITLKLQPGSIISENELARELNLSRTPVREALIELSKINVVEIFPQRGTTISLIDFSIVDEAVFLRLVLEKTIAGIACDVMDEDDLRNMEDNTKLQELYYKAGNNDRLIELDDEFHKIIFRACKKERIYNLMKNMMIHFDRVRTLSVLAVKDSKIIADHKALQEAIRNKDKLAAENVMENHLSRYKLNKQEIIDSCPSYFC